jgi:tetratricopeptide (TPR) repeat protein
LAALARALGGLRRFAEAELIATEALQPTGGHVPSDVVRGEVFFALGEMLVGRARFHDALPHLLCAQAEFARSRGGDDASVAQAHYVLAMAYQGLMRANEAERALTRSIAILTRAPSSSFLLQRALLDLAIIQAGAGRPAEARDTLALFHRTMGDRPLRYPLTRSLGAVRLTLGEHAGAAEALQQAVDELAPRAEGVAVRELAGVLSRLGVCLLRLGRYPEAESVFVRQLAAERASQTPDGRDFGTALNNIAVALREQGRLADAEEYQREALRIQEAAVGCSHPTLANTLKNLGLILTKQGRRDEAIHTFRRALTITEAKFGAAHAQAAEVRNCIAAAEAQSPHT